MPKSDRDLDGFSRLVEALRPWLTKGVFIGGWAHRLYRERPEAITLAYQALRTKDADVALDPALFTRSDEIGAWLAERGFTERMSGDERPPVTHYHLDHEALGFYAEFRAVSRNRDWMGQGQFPRNPVGPRALQPDGGSQGRIVETGAPVS